MITTRVQIFSIKLLGNLHCHWVLVLFYTPESVDKDKQSLSIFKVNLNSHDGYMVPGLVLHQGHVVRMQPVPFKKVGFQDSSRVSGGKKSHVYPYSLQLERKMCLCDPMERRKKRLFTYVFLFLLLLDYIHCYNKS